MSRKLAASFSFLLALSASALADTISTFAGGGAPGDGIAAIHAQLKQPAALARDAAGNVYFAEAARIRRIAADGKISTFAGRGQFGYSGDGGPARQALLSQIVLALAVDAGGNLYFRDGQRIRRIDTAGIITTVAGNGAQDVSGDGGPAMSAGLGAVSAIAFDGAGNVLVAAQFSFRVRKVAGGIINTVAGTGAQGTSGDGGPALQATLSGPSGLAADGAGGFFIADDGFPARIRRVDAAGNIAFVASLGTSLFSPGLSRDNAGNLHVVTASAHRALRIDAAGVVSALAGTGAQGYSGDGGPATAAMLAYPSSVIATPAGEAFVADWGNGRIRRVGTDGIITTFAGGGTGNPDGSGCPADGIAATDAAMGGGGMALGPGGALYVVDSNHDCVIRVDASGMVSRVAGRGRLGVFSTPSSGDGGLATAANLNSPWGPIAVDPAGNVYFAEYDRIRKVDTAGTITTIAGGNPSGTFADGIPAVQAKVQQVGAMAFHGGNLYYTDLGSPVGIPLFSGIVRRIDAGGIVRTVAGGGTDPDGSLAILAAVAPTGLAFDPAGNLLIAGDLNATIRKVVDNRIFRVAGSGASSGPPGDGGPAGNARFEAPLHVAADAEGTIFTSEQYSGYRVRRIDPAGIVNPVAGTGTQGWTGDGGDPLQATFEQPANLAFDANTGALYVFDAGQSTLPRIRRIVLDDRTPAQFAFPPVTGVAVSSVVQSAALTPSGFAFPASISMFGAGEYSVGCTGTFTTSPGTLTPGQSVCVRHTSAGTPNMDVVTTLFIGRQQGRFRSTTAPGAGTLQVAPSQIDFGAQPVNVSSLERTVTLTNTGNASVYLNAITVPGGFLLGSYACVALSPGASCTVAVTFWPLDEGPATGTLTVQASSGTQTVALAGTGNRTLTAHYYRSILRREPDVPGLAFWNGEAARAAARGANANEALFAMAMAFYFSAEYAGFNRSDSEFLIDLYNTFFLRVPDSGGLAFWSGQLAQGLPREVALAEFMFSTEFKRTSRAIFGNTQARAEVDMVMDFYRGLLARLPDDSGLDFWVGKFRAAQCAFSTPQNEADSMSRDFITGAEYTGRNRSNSQYVGDLYNAFLRRGGDLAGVQHWLGRLDSSQMTREALRQEFLRAGEFQNRLYAVYFQGCLR